jgi:hypothetical protein
VKRVVVLGEGDWQLIRKMRVRKNRNSTQRRKGAKSEFMGEKQDRQDCQAARFTG